MFEAMTALAERSVMERVVLLVNHVLAAEPAAVAKLRPHAGKAITVFVDRWPVLLPSLPSLTFAVTPAGLVEWVEHPAEDAAALRVRIDVPNPAMALARLASGERPKIEIEGDATFATDVDWLVTNLHWDVEDDLAKVVGNAPARAIAELGRGFARALRETARVIGNIADSPAGR